MCSVPKRLHVDKKLYGWKPVHYVNGVPWPRVDIKAAAAAKNVDVPLKEEYLMRSMDYLDTDEAKMIFDAQADIIMKNQMTGIIDVGCRIGRINDILHDRGYTGYSYLGFDTSPEPIAYSQQVWSEYQNINYRHASWDERDKIAARFPVDCVIWSGVLLYRPDDHQRLFEELTIDFYKAKYAIIQEPMPEQSHWLPGLALHTIAGDLSQYKNKYSFYREQVLEAPIFSGRRKIVEIHI